MNESLLMIFVKNPVRGKVKTRLAATIGDDRALKVYEQLLEHTRLIASFVHCDKSVFYSDFIDEKDQWKKHGFAQQLQHGNDLGERMKNAFLFAFSKGYKHAIIIGSDCFELNDNIIAQGFAVLKDKDVVIGPAADGGYYLLGMNKLHSQLFANKSWSTPSVYLDTVKDILHLNLSHAELVTLHDIDEEKDLISFLRTA